MALETSEYFRDRARGRFYRRFIKPQAFLSCRLKQLCNPAHSLTLSLVREARAYWSRFPGFIIGRHIAANRLLSPQ